MNGELRMLTWPSRLLLALASSVTGFALTGTVIQGIPVPAVALDGPPSTTAEATALPVGPPEPASPPPTAPPTPPPTPTPAITIAFGGDVHGEPPIAGVLEAGDNPLAGVAPLLEAADIAVVNLETAVGTTGVPADKQFTFQADAGLAEALADAGVDVVSLANNHALDFGHDAAAETVGAATAAGLAPIGYGEDAASAYAPHIVDVAGRTVAFVGLSRVLPDIAWAATDRRPGMASAYDVDAAIAAVEAAARRADHVVVAIHWGQERATCPDGTQLALARKLAAAGADAIVGHHPHVLQGVADVDGTLVAYSLGNFVFYATRAEQRETGVLTITLGEGGVEGYRWAAATIDAHGRPQLHEAVGDATTADAPLRHPGDEDGCVDPA